MTTLDCLRLPGQPERELFHLRGPEDYDFDSMDNARREAHREASTARLIQIDNVADYFWDTFRPRDADANDATLFPNLAPPLPDCFFDYHFTKNMRAKLFGAAGTEITRIGARYQALDLSLHPEWRADITIAGVDGNPLWSPAQIQSAKWVVLCEIFETRGMRVEGPGVSQMGLVDDAGRAIGRFAARPPIGLRIDNERADQEIKPGVTVSDLTLARARLLQPMFFAISLLHCKNTTLTKQSPPAPLSKRFERRHGLPLVRYEVLNIQPIREVLKREGGIEQHGLEKAMHICRGHFKDYREHGLFGKQKAIFWWGQHVRGKLDSGLVVKDYQVKRP